MEKEIRFKDEELDILVMLIKNELEYYERKEDMYPEDYEYVEKLKEIMMKVW